MVLKVKYTCSLVFLTSCLPVRRLLQGITADHNAPCGELKLLEAQADAQLREERSKSSTLLQMLQGAPVKTEVSLLKDNQQLAHKLQESEEKLKVRPPVLLLLREIYTL